MVGRATELAKHTLDSSKIRDGLLLDRRGILVLKITEFSKKFDLLGVHHFDTFGKLVERMPVVARADCIGVGVVTIGNDAESDYPRPATAADRSGARKGCQGQAGKRCR